MKFNSDWGNKSIIDKAIVFLVACFVIQCLFKLALQSNFIERFLSLSGDSLLTGKVWTLATYSFLHDGPIHLIFNLLGLHFIARSVERSMDRTDFVWLCILSATIGGLIWVLFNPQQGILLGSSAVVMACLTYFCMMHPNDHVSFLLFFVLPLRLKPKIIVLTVLGIELYGFIFTELKNEGAIAHSAHLGGMLSGLMVLNFFKTGKKFPVFKFKLKKNSNPKRNFNTDSSVNYEVDLSGQNNFQKEVDRILDKINDRGFGSLTGEEKKSLEKAKSFLNKN
jgi:membrane associated rhomboid family serine protease